MANNFDSNFTRQLARVFLKGFENDRVLSKNVNTQLLKGRFDPASGANVDFKRPNDYVSVRTSDGDLTSETASSIITGHATGTVQNYFTAFVDYDEADEAIKMDQLDQLLAPMSKRIATDLELDFATFMMKNSGLLAGTVGVSATTWDHVAEAGAVLQANGVPSDMPWWYTVNPFTQRSLASNQRSLGAGGSAGALISEAHKKATIASNFAGFDGVMTATTLPSYTTFTSSDRAGTLTAAPTPTYLGAKDSMTQTLAVTAFGADTEVRAGDVIQVTGSNRLNLSTRKVILDENGSKFTWTAVCTTAVTLNGSGAGNIVVTGPGIFETDGAYNTVDVALTNGAVVTLLGDESTTLQPNLFWHKDGFSIGSVPMKKLHATDTLGTTEDGLQIRVTKVSDGIKNLQKVRFDLRPAYAVLNPFFSGHGYGSA